MSDIVERLADTGDWPGQRSEPPLTGGNATVTDAAAGTFTDGRKKITVTWQGMSIDCAYLAAYTPALDDVVMFVKAGGSFLVLGKPAR